MQRGEEAKSVSGIAAISRHSERQRKNPAYYCNTSKLKGIHMKNFSETDQASMPLGVFASKSVTCRHSNADLHKKSAFTLAEVLITLGIIGVVAAITLPVLLNNVDQKVKAERIKNIKQKLSKVTDKMAVQSGLMGYDSTDAFVREMQRHMKIAKVCDNAHLASCWPTKEVILNDEGETWDISKTKNAKTLKISDSANSDWASTIGIVTADGTSMILSYDKKCSFDVDKFGLKSNSDGSISASSNCISGVYDWNGGKKPNRLGQDVLTLGMASGLGAECALGLGKKCFTAPFVPSPLTRAECEAEKDSLGIDACCPYSSDSESYCGDKDFWAGAVKQCGGVKNMPTAEDLAKLATELYGVPVGAEEGTKYATLNASKATSLGLDPDGFSVWANKVNFAYGEPYSAHYRMFSSDYTEWGEWYGYRSSGGVAICAGN